MGLFVPSVWALYHGKIIAKLKAVSTHTGRESTC